MPRTPQQPHPVPESVFHNSLGSVRFGAVAALRIWEMPFRGKKERVILQKYLMTLFRPLPTSYQFPCQSAPCAPSAVTFWLQPWHNLVVLAESSPRALPSLPLFAHRHQSSLGFVMEVIQQQDYFLTHIFHGCIWRPSRAALCHARSCRNNAMGETDICAGESPID